MGPAFGIKFFGALFAVMNPLMVLPIFLSLTDGLTAEEQRRTALAVALYAAVMCAAISLAGPQILAFFGVGTDDFRVAGGMVLVGIAFSMLNGAGNPAHEGGAAEQGHHRAVENVAFYPLTFPMVVGPGTITTLIVFMHQAKSPADLTTVAVVVSVILAAMAVVLYFAAAIGAHLSQTLRVIMSRLMGMILLAIAVGMVIAGLAALLPGLAR